MKMGTDVSLKGDSGGKAELLNLLAETRQPVILACNEIMGLWGRGSTWSSTRDRFTKHLLTITFDRASDEALRRIARRVLREENLEFDDAALEALVDNNPGDLRASRSRFTGSFLDCHWNNHRSNGGQSSTCWAP